MRRSPLVLASSLTLMMALSACANGSTHSSSGSATPTTAASSTPAASSSASAPAASASGAVPSASAATTTGPALPAGTELPTATGKYGDKPTLTFPAKTGAPTKLSSKVLVQGTGPVVAKNDLLMADYLGQIWGGKVFDNSYDRKAPTGFTIGAGKVIPGWDKALVGLKAGTRILLSIPPADGYGTAGQPSAGIKATDTLVFVVDVIASYNKSVSADPKATMQTLPAAGPQVSGPLTGAPTITIPAGAAQPTKAAATVVDKGTGKPVGTGTIVVQYVVVSWTGQAVDSTWTTGSPAAFPIGGTQTTVFDQLKGDPIGSRVLLVLPASSTQTSASASPTTQPAVAVAVDIVAEVPTAKNAP
ncbi:MAG: peptidylprolyl isomerase [Frankiales bacterium]|nr:peptidylprolyl isomerase [Frankiales bacterium]